MSQAVTFPNGTTFGGASGRQASSLAQIMVDSNNNNMKDYEALQGPLQTFEQSSQRQDALSSKNLQTSQHALSVIEHLSQSQGTGEITLFFATGSATLPTSGLQYDRLINFVDYLSRMSRGRKVLFVMIGSASATGNMSVNQKLSQERAQAPEPAIDQYLVNVPHQFFKVHGIGDVYSPKNVNGRRSSAIRTCASLRSTKPPRSRRCRVNGVRRPTRSPNSIAHWSLTGPFTLLVRLRRRSLSV